VVVGTRAEGKAFRWIAGKGITDLGAPAGGTSAAIDTSEDGAVVVGMSIVPPAAASAFRWTAASGLAPIDSTITSVIGVSRDGSVIVGSRPVAAQQMAFRWSASGGFMDLAPSDATLTFATAKNSDGSVVWGTGRFSAVSQVFRWSTDQTSVVSFLPVPATTTDIRNSVEVRAASDTPERVACYVTGLQKETNGENQGERLGSACFGVQLAANAPKDSPTIIDVASALQNLGVDLSGWKLTRSTSISSDGAVLVGNGIDPDGKSQAWIARLP
jgi:uncharacterized membrane protein